MRALILIFLSLSLGSNAFGQSFKYEVILMNKKIGDMSVTKTNSTSGERYILNSESTAKILFIKQSSKVNFDVLYNRGALVKSLYISEKDDENVRTQVHKADNLYKVNSNNALTHVKENIGFSSIMLYFKEPVGVTKIFIEREGGFLPIQKTGAGQYEYTLADGTKNTYRYQNGVLHEIEIRRGVGAVYIRKSA